jgi:signal transduction histidine kinase
MPVSWLHGSSIGAANGLPSTCWAFAASAALALGTYRNRHLREEADLLVRMIRKIQVTAGLKHTLEGLAGELLDVLGSKRVLLAVREPTSARTLLWTADARAAAGAPTLRSAILSDSERDVYLFDAPVHWHARDRRSRGPGGFDVGSLAEHLGCRSFLAVPFAGRSQWSGRLFVLDPQVASHRRKATVRMVTRVVNEIGPVVLAVHQLRRQHARATESERANFARALHDGPIQSLVGVEMRLDALNRRLSSESAWISAELSRLREVVRQELLSTRDLMQRLRPVHVEAEDLLESLADHVAKFTLDTGIEARFFARAKDLAFRPGMPTEVLRIVREALINVRKHSGARNVTVNLVEAAAAWSLTIEDDGRGLSGREKQAGFDGTAQDGNSPFGCSSPAVIKESVKALDGTLAVRSSPSGGLRLEINFPAYPARREPAAAKAPPHPSRFDQRKEEMAMVKVARN